nr:S8 family serine peptidase [Halomonas sp. 707D7]
MDSRYRLLLSAGFVVGALSLEGCSSGGGGGGGGASEGTPDQGVYTPMSQPAPSTSGPVSGVSVAPARAAFVRVGVVDGAFDVTAIANRQRVVDSLNVHTGGTDVRGGNEWHGNVVASTISGGALGVAELDLIKIEQDGVNRSSAINYGVGQAAARGAQVVNASFSQRFVANDPRLGFNGVSSSESLAQVVNANGGKGAVYVISAGNNGQAMDTQGQPLYAAEPALYDMTLIAVGTDGKGNLHPSSAYPGDDARLQARTIATDYVNREVGAQGTSISAARISEYAAGILSRWPHLDARQASQRLLDTASRESALFDRNDCGASGSDNCGSFYLGQGEADIEAALAPQGELVVAEQARVDDGGDLVRGSYLQLSGAYGDAVRQSDALRDVAVFDDLGRDYRMDLGQQVQPRVDHATQMRRQMERLSLTSARAPITQSMDVDTYRFTTRSDGGGLLSSRFDAAYGPATLSLYSFAGGEVNPMSAYSESGLMPMMSFQGGSALTQAFDGVNGVTSRYALGEHWDLTASHWASTLDSAGTSDYRARRSDVGVSWQPLPSLAIDTFLGSLDERQGLLGASGVGALGLGEENRMTFAGIGLTAELGAGISGFAEFEQGQGSASGRGLLASVEDIVARKVEMGLQWQGSGRRADERLAFTLRQPLRIEGAEANFDVPVGRQLDGTVVRESRSASLAPSGREIDIELGYAFKTGERSQWQLNLLHALEPGHDASAPSDTAAMVNYAYSF